MIVTAMTEITKSKVRVTLEDETAFVLYKGDLRVYRFRVGEEIAESTYDELMNQTLLKRAKLRCMNLLRQRDYTESELRRKLQAGGYPVRVTEGALSYVASYGYIGDDNYARKYIETYRSTKSRMRIEQELMRKGIGRELIRELYEQIDALEGDDPEEEQIRALLIKKGYDEAHGSPDMRRKIYAFLMRRGYCASKITRCMNGYEPEQEWEN